MDLNDDPRAPVPKYKRDRDSGSRESNALVECRSPGEFLHREPSQVVLKNSRRKREALTSTNPLVTFKSVGMDPLLSTMPLFPAMAIFLKGISIALGAGG